MATIVLAPAPDCLEMKGQGVSGHIDWLGSLLVTASLMAAIYAIVKASGQGWGSSSVLGFGALAVVLMGAFLAPRGEDCEPDHAAARVPHARLG